VTIAMVDWNGDGSLDERVSVRSGHWYLGTDYCFPSTQTSSALRFGE